MYLFLYDDVSISVYRFLRNCCECLFQIVWCLFFFLHFRRLKLISWSSNNTIETNLKCILFQVIMAISCLRNQEKTSKCKVEKCEHGQINVSRAE
ncbi:Protein of unknown function [Gryllus bimaculatus]|nr:Protein of unknown function [Gryllus bimaculatus]